MEHLRSCISAKINKTAKKNLVSEILFLQIKCCGGKNERDHCEFERVGYERKTA